MAERCSRRTRPHRPRGAVEGAVCVEESSRGGSHESKSTENCGGGFGVWNRYGFNKKFKYLIQIKRKRNELRLVCTDSIMLFLHQLKLVPCTIGHDFSRIVFFFFSRLIGREKKTELIIFIFIFIFKHYYSFFFLSN